MTGFSAATACISENVVLAMMRGSLGGDARSRVETHIDACASCQELFALVSSGLASTPQRAVDESGRRRIPRRLAPGTMVGRYRIREPIGAGAMGIVYLADDRDLNRPVALKMLRAQDEQASVRLQREAQALARVSHPNVIVVYEVGAFDGQVFMAMEYADGGSLTSWLATNPRTTREILDVFTQAGRGLAVAHAAGLVHRDFKPDNVLVGKDGRVRVVDFGLARTDALLHVDGDHELTRDKGALLTLTRTGAFVGTPAYMAPEQHDGHSAGARSDQFGFCVALFEALYRARPFEAHSIEELARAVRAGRVRRTRTRRVPQNVERAILRGLRVRPEDRFESMDALLTELSRTPRRGVRVAISASIAVVAFVGLSFATRGASTASGPPAPQAVPSTVATPLVSASTAKAAHTPVATAVAAASQPAIPSASTTATGTGLRATGASPSTHGARTSRDATAKTATLPAVPLASVPPAGPRMPTAPLMPTTP